MKNENISNFCMVGLTQITLHYEVCTCRSVHWHWSCMMRSIVSSLMRHLTCLDGCPSCTCACKCLDHKFREESDNGETFIYSTFSREWKKESVEGCYLASPIDLSLFLLFHQRINSIYLKLPEMIFSCQVILVLRRCS